MTQQPESKIVRECQRYLKELQASGVKLVWWKQHGSALQRAGVPDIYVLIEIERGEQAKAWREGDRGRPPKSTSRARHLWVEVKTKGGKVRALQKHFIDMMNSVDRGCAHVVRSLAEFREVIRKARGIKKGEEE